MAATEDKPTELAVGTGEGEVHKVDQGDDMAGGLFQDVLFDVIRSDKLPESDAQKVH